MDSSRYATIDTKARATQINVRNLVEKVERGEVRVPDFQRPLRWRADAVRLLFDSLHRGYPIGALLMWRRPAPAESIRFAWTTIDAPAQEHAWYVVDGQQRTTALAAALAQLQGRDTVAAARWQVFFDTRTGQFDSGTVAADDLSVCVPLHVLGDIRRLGRWAVQNEPSDEAYQRAENAQKRILDYEIPLYEFDTADEAALRGAFARLNSTGARMRADEVFDALFKKAGTRAFDLSQLQRVCSTAEFGELERHELLKIAMAVSGLDPSRRTETLSERDLSRIAPEAEVESALLAAVTFLQDRCGVPRVKAVPYPVTLSILARWFHLFPKSDDEVEELLRRWFWRGAVTGAHARAEVSRMREQVFSIRQDAGQSEAEAEHRSLARLLDAVRRRSEVPPAKWELSPVHLKSAASRIEALALLALRPRARSGAELTGGHLFGLDRAAREVFNPKHVPDAAAALGRTMANRVLLDEAHTGLGAVLRSWSEERHGPQLRSHAISEQAHQALRVGDEAAFLQHRSDTVRTQVERFVSAQCVWDAPDVFPARFYDDRT